jgi:hypothetical protein
VIVVVEVTRYDSNSVSIVRILLSFSTLSYNDKIIKLVLVNHNGQEETISSNKKEQLSKFDTSEQ